MYSEDHSEVRSSPAAATSLATEGGRKPKPQSHGAGDR